MFYTKIGFLLFFFFVISFDMSAQDNKVKNQVNPNGFNVFYYPNGVKSSEGYMKDGKPTGYWITYYPTGKKKSEGNRKNFLLDSVWIFYDEWGDTTAKISYYLDKKNGWYYEYYTRMDSAKKNTVKYKVLYVDDKRQGTGYFYYPDGKLWKKVPYKDNYEHGKAFEYSPDGRLITITTYSYGNPVEMQAVNRYDKNGKRTGLWLELYDNGQVKWEATYKNGLIDGYYKEYSRFGSLRKLERYKNGKLIIEAPGEKTKQKGNLRLVEKFYPDKKLKFSGTYNDTIPVGIHKFYSPDGKLQKALWYDETGVKLGEGMLDTLGRKTGEWRLFYPDGSLMAQGQYKADKRVGKWKFYYKNGKLEQEGEYISGEPDGQWILYYPDGKILRVENYIDGLHEGPYIELSQTGDTVLKTSYASGLLNGQWYLNVGDMIEQGQYKYGKRDGTWKTYYAKSGHLACVTEYRDGYREGKHRCYYDNRKLKEQGQYLGNKKNGEWFYYTPEGYLFYTITYELDKIIKVDGRKID